MNQEAHEEKNRSLLMEFWLFMKVRKKWWLLPILVTIGAVGGLIILSQSSAFSPFIYTLF